MSDSESGTPGAEAPPSRRSVLKGLAGAAGLAVVPGALLEACSSSKKTVSTPSSAAPAATTSAAAAPSSAAAAPSSAAAAPSSASGGGGGAATGTISFGSNYSDAVPKAAFAAMIGGFTSANSNAKVTINTVDHNTFQNNINNYLQGTPDDLFTWFAGFRMRFFASQGLATPIDDVWDKIGANFSDAFKAASKGDDGHYYFVPLYNYPWAVFYRKSVWAAKGYQIPTTWDAFVALQKQRDERVPRRGDLVALGCPDALAVEDRPRVVVQRHEVVVPVIALRCSLERVGEVGTDLVPHVVDRSREALRGEEPHAEAGEPGEQVVRSALQVVVDVVLERVVVDL